MCLLKTPKYWPNEFNQYQKSDEVTFTIYLDLEFIIEKIDGCKNNFENSSATKINEYFPSSFSKSIISAFRSIKDKYNVHRGNDCMKKICEFSRGHAIKIINFKKKKLKLLIMEQEDSYGNAKIYYICK